MARLVVVSNRVGVPTADSQAGGLAIAVRAALKRQPGLWFGWSGEVSDKTKIATQTTHQGDVTYVLTDLAAEDFDEYYNGFANRVLWPILHYRLDLAEYSRRDLSAYTRVNERFAGELHKLLKPDDVIWVHDYHLIPLARALRTLGHQNKIGFFLHVPFPPPEIITALPNHDRLLPALAQYDLIGFQTESDAANFARYLATESRLPSRGRFTFEAGERTVQIGVFPIGIETAEFHRLARRSVRSPFVREVVDSLAGRAMIIGVDRLDYSKGLPQRLDAFEGFLRAHPEWHGKVTYLQITPKSRSDIENYAEMDQLISGAAGRINGTYGAAAWTPIRYVNRAYSRSALSGLYRSAPVGLVTPLRDGMNLVAKEYVAAQDERDPGVLVLSRFAGAAVEFEAALLVNPYDPEAVAASIARALAMPLAERRERHKVMFEILCINDVKSWADRFLRALTRPGSLPNWLDPVGYYGPVNASFA